MQAKDWLRDNDPARRFKPRKFKARVSHKRGKVSVGAAAHADAVAAKAVAEEPKSVRGGSVPPMTALAFIKANVAFNGDECLFMPFANGARPRAVAYRGVKVTCSRLMCLLAHGEPQFEKAVSRHLCGNGHLSCVNPAHLAWGTGADNVADALVHKALPMASAPDLVRAALDAERGRHKD